MPRSLRRSATNKVTAVDLIDRGPLRNTLVQLMSNLTGVVFTGALTLFLVRALGTSGYGRYALAGSVAALLVLPAGLGLPGGVGRYLADHRNDVHQVRAIFRFGLKYQAIAALVATVGLFGAAGPVAAAYGEPDLVWPLRFMALSVLGQALFGFLGYAGGSLRQSSVRLRMALVESATETSTSILLVVLGAGAAGAALGKAVGYTIAMAAGMYLMLRLLGGSLGQSDTRLRVGAREVLGYCGAEFVVDVGFAAITQIDILLIAAVLTSSDVGSFSAVLRIVVFLGYLGTAVAGGVAPRLSFGDGSPNVGALRQAIRYLLISQGLVLAPMLVWSVPIVHLLLGSKYESSASIMQALSVMVFVSAPAAVISLSISYLGGARRRAGIVAVTLVLGVICTYGLLQTVGLVGAAIADDLVALAYVMANLWTCSRLVELDLRSLPLCLGRVLLAACAMALALVLIGTEHLSPVQWLIGAAAGTAAYLSVLLLSGEMSVAELHFGAAKLRNAARLSTRFSRPHSIGDVSR
jgi:O-antigen/teichoic acid export membrane protein